MSPSIPLVLISFLLLLAALLLPEVISVKPPWERSRSKDIADG